MTLPPAAPNPMVSKPSEPEIGLIQGSMPDSVNEWYVSLALDKLDIRYMFQYSILGGTSVRGGQVIDFLVFSPIGSMPVFVQGSYWHNYRNDPEQQLKLANARHYFKTEPVLLTEAETDSYDHALVAVREKVLV